MNISEEIVEATAKALWDAMPYEDASWEDLPHDLLTVRNLKRQARVALSAGGPLMAAQELRNAELALCRHMAPTRERGEARMILIERADELGPQ